MKNRKAILVLGFHRSGTSALAGSLAMVGGKVPNHLIEPVAEENAKGFWESKFLSGFNENFLQERNRSWRSLGLAPSCLNRLFSFTPEDVNRLTQLIVQEFDLGNETDATRPIVIKDPRLCLLLPLWCAALDQLGFEVCCILILRDPIQCARSLEYRDGLNRDSAILLWLQYALSAERYSRELPRTVVTFDQLLEAPARTLGAIESRLALDLTLNDASLARVIEFLDPTLLHHQAANDELLQTPHLVAQAFKLILSASDSDSEHLDNMSEAVSQVLSLVLPELDTLASEIKYLDESLSQEGEVSRAAQANANMLAEQNQKLNEAIAQLSTRANQVEARFEVLQGALVESNSRLLSVNAKLHGYVKENEALPASFLGRFIGQLLRASHAVQSFPLLARFILWRRKVDGPSLWIDYCAIRDSGDFDADYYVSAHPELKFMLTHPLIHYVTVGRRLGYSTRNQQ